MKNPILARNIKSIRIKSGLTMEDFGKKIDNAHKSLVSKWEQGKSIPSNHRLVKIAELGNTTTEFLLNGETPDNNAIDKLVEKYVFEDRSYIKDNRIINNDSNVLYVVYKQALENVYYSYGYIVNENISDIDSKIKEICLRSFEDVFYSQEYTNEGAINYMFNMQYKIIAELDKYFYYPRLHDRAKINRENANLKLYDELSKINDDNLNRLNLIKKAYIENIEGE